MPRYPITIYGVECASNEDVQRAVRERRDDPDRDRTPLRFKVTRVEYVEIDPMWLDEEGRVMWRASPLEVGGETPMEEQYRKSPIQFLQERRQHGAGSTFKGTRDPVINVQKVKR